MTLVLATRGSGLALWQANWVAAQLKRKTGAEVTIEVFKTTGDRMQTERVEDKPSKGLFTKELEEALFDGRADLAVHSCKDLPVDLPEGLVLGAIPERASPWDVLVTPGEAIEGGDFTILTGSPRRVSQWQLRHSHHEAEMIRGNVDTRIRKIRDRNDPCGLILARAGLDRLQPTVSGLIVRTLTLEEMVPAPAQGALGIEVREDRKEVLELVGQLAHEETTQCVEAERSFLRAMGGGCQEPLGAFGELDGDSIRLTGFYAGDENPGERHVVESSGDAGVLLAEKFKA